MTIYISGPISGFKDRNKKVFSTAQRVINSTLKSLKVEKIKVINPVKLGYKLDKQFQAAGKQPPEWENYMRARIKDLMQCDIVYLLSGWGDSQGAVIEKYLAERLKIPCAENITDFIKLIKEK
jgi:hypothetical protein